MFQDCPGCTPPIVRTLSLLAAAVIIAMVLAHEALSPAASAKIDDNAPAENAEYSDSGDSAEAKAPPKKAETKRDWPSHVQVIGTPVFDDGSPDMLPDREMAFERWAEENPDTWELLDDQLRNCVQSAYVNAFMNSPEVAIDWCLAQADRADAEGIDED